MKTFQLIFRNGLTQKLETIGFDKGRLGFVFMLADGQSVRFTSKELLRVEELAADVRELRPRRPKASRRIAVPLKPAFAA